MNFFRALAAFWVAVAHCLIWGGWLGLPVPDPKLAVDLFMVLSGFLMAYTTAHGADARENGAFDNWRAFYLRRFLRIAPMYYATLAAVVALSPQFLGGLTQLQALTPHLWSHPSLAPYLAANIRYDGANILAHASFAFGLMPSFAASTLLPDWSLGLEMQFYLAFPLVMLAAARFSASRAFLALTGACLLISALVVFLGRQGVIGVFAEKSFLPFKLPMFLVGVLLFEAGKYARLRRRPLAAAAAVFAVSAWEYGAAVAPLLALLLALAALWLVSAPQRLLRALNHPLIAKASDASYSVYLLHTPVIALLGAPLESFLLEAGLGKGTAVLCLLAAVLIVVYPLSYLCYRLIEAPSVALGKQLSAAPADAVAMARLSR